MENLNKNVDTETLREWLEEDEKVIVVDVRPKEQREEWYISGSIYLDAYQKLNSGDYSILDEIEIPKNTKVVTVCAAGRTSQIASDEFRKKGIESYSLEGGMKGWTLSWNTAECKNGDMTIVQIRRTGKGCLSYMIGSRGEAAVIDASVEVDVYEELAKEYNWQIKYVLDTHLHADHLSRSSNLAHKVAAHFYMPKNEKLQFPHQSISDGDVLTIGNSSLKAIHTPGHTLDSTSFLLDNSYLFTGDTLFVDGVGRPDLKADEEQTKVRASLLYDSLQKILALNRDTIVYPGHISKPIAFDKKTINGTLHEISKTVTSLKFSKEGFISNIISKIPATPPNYLKVSELNIAGKFIGVDPKELEAGANRCAIS